MVTILTMICFCIFLILAIMVDIVLCIPVALIVGAIYGMWILIKWIIKQFKE